MGIVMVEIPVDEKTAAALADPHRLEAVGQLVNLMINPTADADPLALLLETTRREAEAAGITQQDIDDELAAWKAERAARRP
jgi:Glu-tRNA(Gln) amidotransferase subunit E-like FAD-binding protein